MTGTQKLTTNQRIEQKKPIEVWENSHGWRWAIYRKYQKPVNEAKNPYARWFCGVVSPFTYGSEELGDTYVRDVTQNARCTFREE